MNRRKNLFLIGIMLLLAACTSAKPTATPTETESPLFAETVQPEPTIEFTPTAALPKLSEEALKNSIFYAPQLQKSVYLTGGNYASTDSTGMISVVLYPDMAFGDLNNDGVDDAAVILAENGGGSGVFYSLVVIVSNGLEFEQIDSFYIDDRPAIESIEIKDGNILLNATVHSLTDAMVEPTFNVERTYRLLNNKLTLISQSSVTSTGTDRYIQIDTPVEGSEVSADVEITGSMAIAPFENQLSFRVLDLKGNELINSGFMVTSEDVGTPATFSYVVTLPDLQSGTEIRLELAELSMADGSIMTMNSVVVRCK